MESPWKALQAESSDYLMNHFCVSDHTSMLTFSKMICHTSSAHDLKGKVIKGSALLEFTLGKFWCLLCKTGVFFDRIHILVLNRFLSHLPLYHISAQVSNLDGAFQFVVHSYFSRQC